MEHRMKLFMRRDIYNLPASDEVFIQAMRENIAFHTEHCPGYREVLERLSFDPSVLRHMSDLHKMPPLPTSFLKNNTLLSKPYEELLIKTSSSGTGGKKTLSGFDASSGLCGLSMLLRVFHYHELLSLKWTNYILLGYQPHESNQTAIAKSLRGFTLLAPRRDATYALIWKDGDYQLNTEGIIKSICRYAEQDYPVRILGLPAYCKLLLDELQLRGIKLRLHPESKLLVGGGWKAFFADEISREELFRMAEQTLGMRRQNCKDQFGTAEHPINYVTCRNNHFHVPIFSRVIIRDVKTLEPVPNGTPGLLNLISPLLTSAPYGSILTDDIAVMRNVGSCGCGIASPYFEILGRVGLASVKTCAQNASAYLGSI